MPSFSSQVPILLLLQLMLTTSLLGSRCARAASSSTPPILPVAQATAARVDETTAVMRQIWQLETRRASPSEFSSFCFHRDPEIRARANRALARLGSPDSIPLLRQSVTDEDPAVRREAAFALGQSPGGASVAARALDSETDAAVVQELLLALGAQGESEYADNLVSRVLMGSGPVCAAAARALGSMATRLGSSAGEPARKLSSLHVVQALLSAQRRTSLDCRRGSAFALARIRPSIQDPSTRSHLEDWTLGEADPVSRAWLARAASTGLDNDGWLRTGRELARDSCVGCRVALARGLSQHSPGSDSAAILAGLTRDPERWVRLSALETAATPAWAASGYLQSTLSNFLMSQDSEVQGLALLALLESPEPPSPEAWLAPDVHPRVRARVASHLENLDRLKDLAWADPDQRVRTAAVARLLQLPAPEEVMLALLDSQDQVLAAGAAATMAAEPLIRYEGPLIRRLETCTEPELCLYTIRALNALYGSSGSTGGAPSRALVQTPDPRSTHLALLHTDSTDLRLRAASRELLRLAGQSALPSTQPTFQLPPTAAVAHTCGASVSTDRGEFRIELFPDEAPTTVWFWAKLARTGFYDGLTFHRAVPDFVVQTGDPRGDGWGGAGTAIPDEPSPLPFAEYTVGMALAEPDSGNGQWFVTLSPQPHLYGQYAIFGRVTHGRDVLVRLRLGDRIRHVRVLDCP